MAAEIYDSVYILAKTLDKAVKSKVNIYDGQALLNLIKNQTYRSKLLRSTL